MHSRTAKLTRGFTLLEILVVIGMCTIVAGLVLSIGLHTHSGFTFTDDEEVLVATLQKARSQSMSGLCIGAGCTSALAHGVHAQPHGLVLFQGTTYDSTDSTNEYIAAESGATTFTGNDIIFMPLSGNTNGTSTIMIFDAGVVAAVVTVGPEGQLSWSH